MEGKEGKLSILMFPWVGHGHISPYLELAKLLSKQNFTIFFCSTPINLKSIRHSLQSTSDHLLPFPINLVDLHLPSSPDLPPELHTTKHVPPHLMPHLLKSFHASQPAFSAILTSLNPTMLIYDAFQPWAAAAAHQLGIPAVHFATTGAAAYSFFYHLVTNKDGTPFPHDAIYLRPSEWAALQHAGVKQDSDQKDFFPHFSRSRDVVLMKTSRGIEGKYIDYLSLLCNKKIVAVGPLVTQPTTASDHSGIIDWLAKKDKFSTIFISFGSENYLSENQMQEMAKGLEASRANFIWVVRSPRGGEREREAPPLPLPAGFIERVGERGKVVEGWAPQTKILAHENICGFISHCGMSSMIESVYFGVPVIAVPIKLDQPLNSRLLVEAGVGVEVLRDDNGDFIGEEVAAAIERVLETGAEMRVKAAAIRETMKMEEELAASEAAAHLRRITSVGDVTRTSSYDEVPFIRPFDEEIDPIFHF